MNKNFLTKDSIIHNIYIGDQNAETIKQTGLELKKLVSQVEKRGKKVLILTDIRQIGKVSLSSRKAGFELMRNLDFHKVAIFGKYFLFKDIIDAISVTTGKWFQVKLFDTEKDAMKWLLIEYI